MSNRETWKKDFKAYVESLSLSRDDYKGIMEYIDEFPDDHNADSDKMADGDCISRQAAIDEIKALYEWHDTVTEDRAVDHLKRLPSVQPEPHWIPCSERLPKPFEYCLWTMTDGRVVYHHCDGLFSKYTAWMPLPASYKGE